MTNTKISEIANDVLLGGNIEETVQAGEAGIKPGMFLYFTTAGVVKRAEGSSSRRQIAGVAGVRYDLATLDTAYSISGYLPLVKDGIVPAFVDDPGAAALQGESLFESGILAGSAGWTHEVEALFETNTSGAYASGLTDKFEKVGELVHDIANGDKVAILKLLR